MPAKPADRIHISSAADLLQYFADIGVALEEPETEDSWQRLDKALARLEVLTKSGGYKFDEYVPQLKAIAAPIRNSLLSDRTKLSGTAADLLNSVAPRLAERFDGLVSAFVPSLLLLCARTNKVALTRAKKCLLLIVKHCRLISLFPLLRDAAKDKAPTLRVVAVECLAGLVEVLEPARIGKKVADIEAVIKGSATDANPEVRQWCKKLFELYVGGWPERVESFTAAFTPTIRRYLALPKTGGLRPAVSSAPPKAVEVEAPSASNRRPRDAPMAESEMVRPSRAPEAEQAHRPRAPAAAVQPVMGAVRVQAAPSRADIAPPSFHMPAPAMMAAPVDPRLAMPRSLSSSHGASGAPGMTKTSFSLASGLNIGNNALMALSGHAQGSRSRNHSAATKVNELEKAHREKRPEHAPHQSSSARREHAQEHHRSADRPREGAESSRSGRTAHEQPQATRAAHAGEHTVDGTAPPSERLFAKLAEVAGQSGSSSSDGHHHGEPKPRHHVKASRVLVPAPVIAPPPTLARHPSASRIVKTLPKGASADRLEALGEQGTPTAASKTPAKDLCEGLEPSPLSFPAPLTLEVKPSEEATKGMKEPQHEEKASDATQPPQPETAAIEAPSSPAPQTAEVPAPSEASPAVDSGGAKSTHAADPAEKVEEPAEPTQNSVKPLNIVKKASAAVSTVAKADSASAKTSPVTARRPGAAPGKPVSKPASSITKTMSAKSSLVGPSAAIAARLKRAAAPGTAPAPARPAASATSSSATARPTSRSVSSSSTAKPTQASIVPAKRPAAASTLMKPTSASMSKVAPSVAAARPRAPVSSSSVKPAATRSVSSSRAGVSATADVKKVASAAANARTERTTKPPVPKASSAAASSSKAGAKGTAPSAAASASRPRLGTAQPIAKPSARPATAKQSAPRPPQKGQAEVEKLKAALEETHGKEALAVPEQPKPASAAVEVAEGPASGTPAQQPEEDVFGVTTSIEAASKEEVPAPTAEEAKEAAVIIDPHLQPEPDAAEALEPVLTQSTPIEPVEEVQPDVTEQPVEADAVDIVAPVEESEEEANMDLEGEQDDALGVASVAEVEAEVECAAPAVEEMQAEVDHAAPACVEEEQVTAAEPAPEEQACVEETPLQATILELPIEAAEEVARDSPQEDDAEKEAASAPSQPEIVAEVQAETESAAAPAQVEASVLLSPPAVDEQLEDVQMPQVETIPEADEESIAIQEVEAPIEAVEVTTMVETPSVTPKTSTTPVVTPSKRPSSKASTPLSVGRSPKSRPATPAKNTAPSSPAPRSPLAPINGRSSRPVSPLKRLGSPLKHSYTATPPPSTPVASVAPSTSPAPYEAAPSPASYAFGDDEEGYDDYDEDEEELPDDSVAQIATSSPIKMQSTPLRLDRTRITRAAAQERRLSRASGTAGQSFSDELTASSGDEEDEDEDEPSADVVDAEAPQARLVRSATGFQLICGAAQ